MLDFSGRLFGGNYRFIRTLYCLNLVGMQRISISYLTSRKQTILPRSFAKPGP